jgi:hypothetical protein
MQFVAESHDGTGFYHGKNKKLFSKYYDNCQCNAIFATITKDKKMAAAKYGWFALRYWAEKLEKKYPRTNLISLSNGKLAQMLLSLEEAEGMSPLPSDRAYFSALADAWAEVKYGRDDSQDIPDAYK